MFRHNFIYLSWRGAHSFCPFSRLLPPRSYQPVFCLFYFLATYTIKHLILLLGKLAEVLQSKQPELGIVSRDVDLVSIAGLCHDLGSPLYATYSPSSVFDHLDLLRFIIPVNPTFRTRSLLACFRRMVKSLSF